MHAGIAIINGPSAQKAELYKQPFVIAVPAE